MQLARLHVFSLFILIRFSTKQDEVANHRRVHYANQREQDRTRQYTYLCLLFFYVLPHQRGSRSFGAKNNDPLEEFVFVGLFERLYQPGGVRGKPQRAGKKILFIDEILQ